MIAALSLDYFYAYKNSFLDVHLHVLFIVHMCMDNVLMDCVVIDVLMD